MKTLKSIMKCDKAKLKKCVCVGADISGREFWYWKAKHDNSGVCLVAHIDIVHPERKKKRIYHDTKHDVYWSPNGLGADDRAGVYGCLKIREKTGCAVLLTDGEEIGGTGANEAVRLASETLKENTSCFIELDRKGWGEAVFYNGETEEFKKFILGYGFRKSIGTFSDIYILGEKLEINSVNLSAGFKNEHTTGEYLNVRSLFYTISNVITIIGEINKNTNLKNWGTPERKKHDDRFFERYYRKFGDSIFEDDDFYLSGSNEI